MHEHPEASSAPPVLVILGPTASGKSTLAMGIAERIPAEIVSVDALKVYRGLDVGTAKPSAEEREHFPHHGIDLVEPNESFSVADFLRYAEPALREITARGALPILDVTAPLYLKALMFGIEEGPEPDPQLRAELESLPLGEVYDELKRLDPERAAKLHPNDAKRIVRAVEILRLGGTTIGAKMTWHEPRADYRWILTGILWPRPLLYERVERRARVMFEAGWLEEVRRIDRSPGFSRTASEAHGYKRLLAHLRGEMTLEEAKQQTIRDVKQYARKSMTFFRRFPRVQWLEVSSEEEIRRAAAYLALEMNRPPSG